jgi:hypothetical protein
MNLSYLALALILTGFYKYSADFWGNYVDTWGDTVFTRILIPWMYVVLINVQVCKPSDPPCSIFSLSTIVYWTYGLALLAVDVFERPAWLINRKFQPWASFSIGGTSFSIEFFS